MSVPRLTAAAGFVLFSSLLCGCAKRGPAVWRLVSAPTGNVLFPPTFAGLPEGEAGPAKCPETPGIRLAKRGRTIRVALAENVLADKPSGWLRTWALDLEARGCLAPGTGDALARRISESIPLDPARAYSLLHEDERITGYVELGPESRLQVTGPLMRDGALGSDPLLGPSTVTGSANGLTVEATASADLIGFETAWYAIRPGQTGYQIVAVRTEQHIQGQIRKSDAPTQNALRFPSGSAYLRLVFKSQTAGQGISEFVVGTSKATDLGPATAEINRTGTCPAGPGIQCLPIPRRVALNSMIVIPVNGREVELSTGASVRDALRAAGIADAQNVLPTLAVLKAHRGRLLPVTFDPTNTAILALRLLGGEQLSWK